MNQPDKQPPSEPAREVKEIARNLVDSWLAGIGVEPSPESDAELVNAIATALQAERDRANAMQATLEECKRVLTGLLPIAEAHRFERECDTGFEYPDNHPQRGLERAAATLLEKLNHLST